METGHHRWGSVAPAQREGDDQGAELLIGGEALLLADHGIHARAPGHDQIIAILITEHDRADVRHHGAGPLRQGQAVALLEIGGDDQQPGSAAAQTLHRFGFGGDHEARPPAVQQRLMDAVEQ